VNGITNSPLFAKNYNAATLKNQYLPETKHREKQQMGRFAAYGKAPRVIVFRFDYSRFLTRAAPTTHRVRFALLSLYGRNESVDEGIRPRR